MRHRGSCVLPGLPVSLSGLGGPARKSSARPGRPGGMRRLDSAGRGPNGTKLADGARFQTLMGPHRTVACQIPDDQLASALHQHLVDRAPRLLMALTGRIRASNTL